MIQCYCTISSERIFSKYSHLFLQYKEVMFLWIESEFSIYFLACVAMLQVSVSLIPVTEADAFLAVPYCLPVTLFFLCSLWQWKDSHCRLVLGATESIPPVHPFPNTAVLRLLPDPLAHHPSLVLGSAEVFLLVDPGVNLVSRLSFAV